MHIVMVNNSCEFLQRCLLHIQLYTSWRYHTQKSGPLYIYMEGFNDPTTTSGMSLQ